MAATAKTLRQVADEAMPEKVLMQRCLDHLAACGYLAYHTHDSRRSQAGFPDIVAVGHGRVLWIECKREKGKLSAEQKTWLDALARAGEQACMVQPSTWDYFATWATPPHMIAPAPDNRPGRLA